MEMKYLILEIEKNDEFVVTKVKVKNQLTDEIITFTDGRILEKIDNFDLEVGDKLN